jgi:hypothetical protein
MATTNLMGDQENDHAARLARFSVEAAAAAQVCLHGILLGLSQDVMNPHIKDDTLPN